MLLTAAASYPRPLLVGAVVLLFTHHVTLLLWTFLVLLVACFLAMRNAYGVLVARWLVGVMFGVTAAASALVQAPFSYGWPSSCCSSCSIRLL